ncbi:MAG: glycerophosphodiester phosphodiesterase family protein [Oscillibacter sp.]
MSTVTMVIYSKEAMGVFCLAWLVAAAALLALVWCGLLWGRGGDARWEKMRKFRYAHRGYHDKPAIPENSLAAFRRAAENGFGAELDVHLTKDGRLAVIHDSSLKRTCGVDGNVEDFTAQELSALRLEGTAERIPFLEEVLPIFEGIAPLVVEIKPAQGNCAVLTEKTVECLDQFHTDYCMESFDPRVLLWLRKNRPNVLRGQLAQNFFGDKVQMGGFQRFALSNLLCNFRTRPDFVAYRFEDRFGRSFRLCSRLWGVQRVYWTIRTREDMALAEADDALVIFEKFDPREEK